MADDHKSDIRHNTSTTAKRYTTGQRIRQLLLRCLVFLLIFGALDGLGLWLAIEVADKRAPIAGLPAAEIHGSQYYVDITGTWTSEPDPQAFPLQTSHIRCSQQTMICDETTVQISDSELRGGKAVDLFSDAFDVKEWTAYHIIYTGDAECVAYTYDVDFATKSVSGIAKRKQDAPKPSCSAAPNEMRLALKDGNTVIQPMREKAFPWFGKLAAAPVALILRVF